jgi:hypothetical protein
MSRVRILATTRPFCTRLSITRSYQPCAQKTSAFGAGVPWVIRANMRRKLSVALQLEVPHHFIKGLASGRDRRAEHPTTLGTTKPSKMLFVDPYKLAWYPSISVYLRHDHSSSRECFGGGGKQGRNLRTRHRWCSYVANKWSTGTSSLGGNRVGSRRGFCARDALRYIVTFVMLVRRVHGLDPLCQCESLGQCSQNINFWNDKLLESDRRQSSNWRDRGRG